MIKEVLPEILLLKRNQVTWIVEITLTERIVHHNELTIREGLDYVITSPGDGSRRGLCDLGQSMLQVLVFSYRIALFVFNLHFVITYKPHEARH